MIWKSNISPANFANIFYEKIISLNTCFQAFTLTELKKTLEPVTRDLCLVMRPTKLRFFYKYNIFYNEITWEATLNFNSFLRNACLWLLLWLINWIKKWPSSAVMILHAAGSALILKHRSRVSTSWEMGRSSQPEFTLLLFQFNTQMIFLTKICELNWRKRYMIKIKNVLC